MAKKQAKTQVLYGGTPSVDLLPAPQRAELQHERTMPKLLLAIVGSGILAALIWAAGMIPGYLADRERQAAEAESQQLLAELEDLSDVNRAVGDLGILGAARAQLTANEVLFMPVRDEIVAALPEGAALASFTGALVGVSSAANDAGGGDEAALELGPLCTAETATITIRVSIGAETDASAFVDSLSEVAGYQCAVGTAVESADGTRAVVVQLALGPDALSGRFSGGDQ